MQLREFAEIILFEPSLPRKLAAPSGPLEDDAPGAPLAGPPAAPARPSALRMPARDERGHGVRTSGRGAQELGSDLERGLVLHAFANHELLALELMALALLRFPDAPTSFRMGLARTMLDEQRHLRLYESRMQALGVALGDAPVSRFFWDCLADMPSPLDFVARMSLTLEQANLDFATHFERLFRAAGDLETARILAEVHQDEIGHVKHGVVWLNRWKEPGKSEWDAYRERLVLPLTPGRAKGPIFEEQARRAAGLTPEFIRALKLYSHSKGRPPALYWLNAAWEEELAARDASGPGEVNAVARAVERDLGALMLFLAKSDDVVWVERRPAAPFLEGLRDAGFAVPQLVCSGEELGQRPFDRFEPWGMSRRARRFTEALPVEFRRRDERPDEPAYASKVWAARLPEAAAFPVRLCRTMAEVRDALFPGWSVVKAPLGASGRNALRVAPHGIEIHQARWIERTLAAQGGVLVEPWVERLADFSVQLDVGGAGKTVLGVTRFLTDARGQYIGHWLNAPYAGLDPTVVRVLHQRDYLATLERTGRAVAAALAAAGHRGPAGMDAFIYRTGEGDVALRPLVEVNARYTMGRIALALERRLYPGTQALWLHLPARRVDVADLRALHPPELRDGRLAGGVLPTTDPAGAELLQTLIFAGPACLGLDVMALSGKPRGP